MSTAAQVRAEWKKGKTLPVYLFHGEEEFTKSEMLTLAVETFLSDPGMRAFNYDVLYGSESKSPAVVSAAVQLPVMTERRVVIVRDADKLWSAKGKYEDDPIRAYLAKPNFDTLLIIECSKHGAKNTHPWKDIFAKTDVVEFAPLKEDAAADWICDRAQKAGRKLEHEAAMALISLVGTDLRQLVAELEKLILFIGERPTITGEDVTNVVGLSRSFNPFDLTKAIGSGNKQRATEMALRILADDKSAKYILIPAIGKYLEQLAITHEMIGKFSDKDIAAAIGLYGGGAYFVKDYITAARRYSQKKLVAAQKAFVQTEFESRIYRMDDTMLFQKLLMEIMP